VLVVGVLAACGAARCGESRDPGFDARRPSRDRDGAADVASTRPGCAPGAMVVGRVADFPLGAWRLVEDVWVIVGRDARGLFAYEAACTHQGCAVGAPDAAGVATCPCHGSQFDGTGAVLRGPARRPLPHYAVVLCGDEVFVDTNTVVAAATRAAVAP
jgi:Rieske Fe-S protein